jgi:hypothetical protein
MSKTLSAPFRAVTETRLSRIPEGPPVRVDVLECGHEIVLGGGQESRLMHRCPDCQPAMR